MRTVTIRRPDDFHLHLRDGAILRRVLADTVQNFERALVMPNLVPPVLTTRDAEAYRNRILEALPDGSQFTPLLTLYLTESTDPDDVEHGKASGLLKALKLYPAGATTNSHSGVKNLDTVMPVLERMAKVGLTLCIHGEVTTPTVDVFDREAVFIETVLVPLRARLPELQITMEHLTTSDAVDYIKASSGNLAGSITPHHLLINRNALFAGGIRPHYYCLPLAKRESHRLALRKAATSGDARFFLGTDSAPHLLSNKECACGCAGIYNSVNAMSCILTVFEEEQALDQVERFASLNGAAWYGLAPNEDRITYEKALQPIQFPPEIWTEEGAIVVFDPMRPLSWRLKTVTPAG